MRLSFLLERMLLLAVIGNEWRAAINSEYAKLNAAGVKTVSIEQAMADALSSLRANILSSGMSGAVQAAILSGISSNITSPQDGVIDIMAPRMSIFGNIGGGGVVNLGALYEYGWQISKDARYVGINPKTGIRISFNLRNTPGFSGHGAEGFVHKTAAQLMAKYPDCIVTVV